LWIESRFSNVQEGDPYEIHAFLESEGGMLSVGYLVLEYLFCIGVALGLATLVFVSSLLVMLAHDGFAYVFRAARRGPRLTTQVISTFAGPDLEGSGSPGIAFAGGHPRVSQTVAAETLSDVAA